MLVCAAAIGIDLGTTYRCVYQLERLSSSVGVDAGSLRVVRAAEGLVEASEVSYRQPARMHASCVVVLFQVTEHSSAFAAM